MQKGLVTSDHRLLENRAISETSSKGIDFAISFVVFSCHLSISFGFKILFPMWRETRGRQTLHRGPCDSQVQPVHLRRHRGVV